MAIARLLFLYLHVVAFALAFGCVLREDARLLSRRPLDPQSLQATSRIVAVALAALWASGVVIVALDSGWSAAAIAQNPKLLSKLLIVCVLTLNGIGLHLIAFPRLTRPALAQTAPERVIAVLGATSAVSWAFATLLGVSRGVAKDLTFSGVVSSYCLALLIGAAAAVVFVAPVIRRKIRANACEPCASAHDGVLAR